MARPSQVIARQRPPLQQRGEKRRRPPEGRSCTTTKWDGKYTLMGTLLITVESKGQFGVKADQSVVKIKISQSEKLDKTVGNCEGCVPTTEISVEVNPAVATQIKTPKLDLGFDFTALGLPGLKIIDASFDGSASFQGTITYTRYVCAEKK
jgi:hypothetical protein